MARATVSPPNPLSNMPMGRSSMPAEATAWHDVVAKRAVGIRRPKRRFMVESSDQISERAIELAGGGDRESAAQRAGPAGRR